MTAPSAATPSANGLPGLAPGVKLWGEVIAWAGPAGPVPHAGLMAALAASGLDETVARELAPRHAFARACRRLSDARIIRQLTETADTITFQFTREARAAGAFEYALETLLTLDKKAGAVACPLPALAAHAQAELDRCLAARTGGDVTRVVQRLFGRHADLFPVRPQGGAYFVPAAHAEFVDRVEALLGRLGGNLWRFPVPAGTAAGDRAVRSAVAEGVAGLIAEHRAAVAAFDADTRSGTLERAAQRVRVVRHKLRAYSELLAGERERLEADLAAAAAELRAKAAALAAPAAAGVAP